MKGNINKTIKLVLILYDSKYYEEYIKCIIKLSLELN